VTAAAKRGVFAYITDTHPDQLQDSIEIVPRRLRPFFYDETEEAPSEAQRNQLVSVAEMYADSLQTALDTLHTLAVYQENRNTEDWTAYSEAVLASSSTLRDLVRGFPEGWPSLTPMLARYDARNPAAVAARD
jgi:hypothetical protein